MWANLGNQFSVRHLKGSDHPNFQSQIDSWKTEQEFIKIQTPKEEFIQACKAIFDMDVEDRTDKAYFYLHHIRHRFGDLFFGNWEEALEVDYEIFNRFAKVFEQTYTRFIDLQKAEAQAREAQIEAALERVRARAMSMRHSDELSEAAELLYREFFKLGVEPFSCCLLYTSPSPRD